MNWKYLLSDVDFGDEEANAVATIVRSKWLSAGEVTKQFECDFEHMMRIKHAIATHSCTAALHLAMMALEIGPGDEVLVPSYTFVASANAILYRGATPVFVDIVGPNNLNLDPNDLKRKTTARTKAVVVVHFAGFMADMDAIMEHAHASNLLVVEDACHAIGCQYLRDKNSPHYEKYAGTIGDIGCFSFFANKNLATGEGGMLVTNNDEAATTVRSLRSHGMTKSSWDKAVGRATDYDVTRLGYNYRPTELTSAIGRIQLSKLRMNNQRRATLAEHYRTQLQNCPGVSIPFPEDCAKSANHIMPILVPSSVRGQVRESLHREGIQTSIHYPPIHRFTHYREYAAQSKDLPMTERVAEREITLPLHPLMKLDDVSMISESVRKTMRGFAEPNGT